MKIAHDCKINSSATKLFNDFSKADLDLSTLLYLGNTKTNLEAHRGDILNTIDEVSYRLKLFKEHIYNSEDIDVDFF